jgi:transposase-like protein
MKIHPVAALFPMMEGEEFDQFVADIKAHGLREPIKTWDDVIVDGRNREKACKVAGIEPRYKEMKFDDDLAAIQYIMSENLTRRHLTQGQRAMIGEELRPRFEEAAKQRQEAGQKKGREAQTARARGEKQSDVAKSSQIGSSPLHVNDQLANMLNVGASTMKMAHKVATEKPELAAKVRSGELTLNAAHNIAKGNPNAGKKRPSTPGPKLTPKLEREIACRVLDDKKSNEEVCAEFGIARETVRVAVAKEEGLRKGQVEAVDPKSLSVSAQEKLEAVTRKALRELESDFQKRVEQRVRELMDTSILAHYRSKLDEAERIVKSRKGIMTRAQHRLILSCLHPDRVAEELKPKYTKAFYEFSQLEIVLCDEKELPASVVSFPSNYAELMKMREKMKAERRAKRSQKQTGAVERR